VKFEFLGDALDHWKGSILSRLQNNGVIEDLAVDPMLTDAEDWHTDDFQLYAELLQIRVDRIIRHKTSLNEDRNKYFAEIEHSGDLFLDPDTGIATKKASPISNYIKIKELCYLLDSEPTRVLCIYQHVRAKETRDRVSELVSALQESIPNDVYSCSYMSSSVAMIFVSLTLDRIKRVNQYLIKYLRRRADKRVKLWQ
jgi:hypothetical protein